MVAEYVQNNGALASLNMSNNRMLTADAAKALVGALAANTSLKELDISSNNWKKYGSYGDWMGDGPGFAKELAIGLHANRAMVTVNVMGNKIGKEQLSKLQEVMQAHPTLVSLCGFADDATEANLSYLGMDADDAAVVADEIPAKGALTSLNISNNTLTGYYGSKVDGIKALAEAIKGHVSARQFV